MSNTPFDSFSKELLEELLAPFGEISLNREVFGESQYVRAVTEDGDQSHRSRIVGN